MLGILLVYRVVLQSFSYNELIQATDNFKEELGKGGFGTVCEGFLSSSHRNVAVSHRKSLSQESCPIAWFLLRGLCKASSLRIHEPANLPFRSKTRLKWGERMKTALDVARGILYLHEDCQPHIIHCDIKPQNTLLDESWTAKISDFGLAKILMLERTRTITMIRGTSGYLEPEWQKNAPISVKSDVYSFGIVLLEILCCRRNIETEVPSDEIILSEWVYNCFMGGQLQNLTSNEEEVEMRLLDMMGTVALCCIQEDPTLRPSMKNVTLMVEGNIQVPIPASPIPSVW